MTTETVIFYTTQTSGTGSIWRILKTLNQGKRILREIGEEKVRAGSAFTFEWSEIPAEGYLANANCHHHLSPIENLKGQKFLVNFRDPRDRICNEFMWNMVHKFRVDEPQEEIAARAAKLREMGIDAWVRERVGPAPLTDRDYYQYFMNNVERIPPEDRMIVGYASGSNLTLGAHV